MKRLFFQAKHMRLLMFFGLFAFFCPVIVFASATDGTISSANRYAWSENTGWIDFATSNGNVHVTDSGLSGYALSETIGWIYLGNVVNDGEGNLSGYAWSENTGFINFDPANGGVVIDSTGYFTGSALSENIGWIVFDGDYKVRTDWRPASQRTSSAGTGGGGSVAPKLPLPPVAPTDGFKVVINNGNELTNNKEAVLKFTIGTDVVKMEISNSSNMASSSGLIPFTQDYSWTLCNGSCQDGEHTVYAKFYTSEGQPSPVVQNSILLDTTAPKIETVNIDSYYYFDEDVFIYGKTESQAQVILHWDEKYGSVLADSQGAFAVNLGKLPIGNYSLEVTPKDLAQNTGETTKVTLKIKERPAVVEPTTPEEPTIPEEVIPEKPAEVITVPETAPISMQGKWELMANDAINNFVLAPLPQNIKDLAEKFPELEKTFEQVGINKITDVEKLRTAKINLPILASIQGIPLANLSAEVKKQLPTDVMFARAGSELIDFNIGLSIGNKGETQQTITTISGKDLELSVKPEAPVKDIKGYVVFNSRKIAKNYDKTLGMLSASLIFANPTETEQKQVEEKLLLSQFEYLDSDNDGIYTAKIQAPVIEGEYEIITIMNYVSIELGQKELRLITIIDPEGYIYRTEPDGLKTRIFGVVVSLFWLNPATKQYELWPAQKYSQQNPQKTDDTGKYSFLVSPGMYYLRAEHSNYSTYQSDNITVNEGSGIHMNIELEAKNWWIKYFDWRTIVIVVFGILLIMFGVLLFYNFHKDKIREK